MKSNVSKNPISKELTNRELADLLVKKIDSLEVNFDKKINNLSIKVDRDIEELAGMTARGFDKCATSKDVIYSEIRLADKLKEVHVRIDQMKFNHDQIISHSGGIFATMRA